MAPLRPLAAAAAAIGLVASVLTAFPAAPATAAGERPVDALLVDAPAPGSLEPIADHVASASDRFDLAGGCFVLRPAAGDGYVARTDGSFAATGGDAAAAEPFRFQAFDLGKYLLYGTATDFLAAAPGPVEALADATEPAVERLPIRPDTDLPRSILDDLPDVPEPDPAPPSTRTGAVTAAAAPSALAEWLVRGAGDGSFTLHLSVDDGAEDDPGPSDVAGDAPVAATLVADGGTLQVLDGTVTDERSRFVIAAAPDPDTCAVFPEVEVNVEGAAATATNPVDAVSGYLDAHLHMMAFEFIGGRSHCGRPWHPYGAPAALVDCPDHEPGGLGAVLESFLSGGQVGHATDGWPTFSYWPRYDSLTHEQVYYRWLERAWRGGLAMFTNLLVDNNALCELYPYKDNSCNEMDGVRLQAQRLRELERYIDAQWGGPGQGWFRIVTDPFEARRTIGEGRLAVVMGIEVSVPFDCAIHQDVPTCTNADIDRELAAVHDLGVRQMEITNKFDNGFTGVTGDNGTTGVIVNVGNFWETGHFWRMRTCPNDGHQHDRTQYNLNDDSGVTGPLLERDAIFGAVLQLTGASGAAPVYPEGPHCNVLGLTAQGRYLVDQLAEHGVLFDPDHMSSKGRQEALDRLQARGYQGVVSSHSWADDSVYERVLAMGGLVTPYAGSSTGFIEKWRETRGWADPRYAFGIGYGADSNGFGSQGAPRNPGEGEPAVTYPFEGLGGVTIHRQVSGEQVYDINTDGVDHYGLYPDWIEDLRILAGPDGDAFVAEMARGAETYLQVWERALGVANDACRDDRVAAPDAAALTALSPGTPHEVVLATIGQPHERSGGAFTYCTSDGAGATVRFAADGTLAATETDGDHPGEGRGGGVGGGRGSGNGPPTVPPDHAGHAHDTATADPAASPGSADDGGSAALRLVLLVLAVAAATTHRIRLRPR